MARRYTAEQREFIAANIKGRRFSALAELVSKRFGIEVTANQMHAYASNHKLTNGVRGNHTPGEPTERYPKAIADFIKKNVVGSQTADLVKRLNDTFGTDYTLKQIRAYIKNHGLRSGIDCRFKPGQPSHNKGMKGFSPPGSEKGWFKPGHAPQNHLDVGAEVMTTDGYLAVKIAEPNVWKQKHILVWEAANGPVPEGHAVIFLDRNHKNTNLENLALVTRAELLELNRRELIKSNAELTASGVLVARVNCKIRKIKKAKKRRQNMKPIRETVQSRKGFYIGDVRKVVSEKLKADITSVSNTGGGLLKDKATGLEVATTFVSSSIIHGAYQATNGDLFDVYSNAFALVPLELITASLDKIGTDGRVVFGTGAATLETTEHVIKITLPSTEVVEIDIRKEVHR